MSLNQRCEKLSIEKKKCYPALLYRSLKHEQKQKETRLQ